MCIRDRYHPPDVYRYFRDVLGIEHIQFIPIVERDNDTGFQEGDVVTDRSVDPTAWGCLLYTSPSPRDRTRSRMPSSA